MTITVEDLKTCHLRKVLHMDGPRDQKSGWWADIHECVEHPRLRRKTTYTRSDHGVKSVWSVDGRNYVETIEEAVEALNGPILPPNEPQFVALAEMRERLAARKEQP